MSLTIEAYKGNPEFYTIDELKKEFIFPDISKKPEGMSDFDFIENSMDEQIYDRDGEPKNKEVEFLGSFTSGYVGFTKMREDIANATGNFHYYIDYSDNPFGSQRISWKEDDQLLLDFFLHSDSDGEFDSEHIKHLYDTIVNMEDIDNQYFKDFKEFVAIAKDYDNIHWVFM